MHEKTEAQIMTNSNKSCNKGDYSIMSEPVFSNTSYVASMKPCSSSN